MAFEMWDAEDEAEDNWLAQAFGEDELLEMGDQYEVGGLTFWDYLDDFIEWFDEVLHS